MKLLTLHAVKGLEAEVVLHPGNPKYQDILIKIEDFFINGIVVGVLRKKRE